MLKQLIKDHKKKYGSTKKHIAEKLGVSIFTLFNWEKESLTKRVYTDLQNISKLFNVSITEIMEKANDKF